MEKFKHKKSLGQNFLKDEKVLNDIVNAIDLQEDDLVIEIGPGQGALTKKLKAAEAQREIKLDLSGLTDMKRPQLLTEEQWTKVLERAGKLERV